jgi:hypothetical protein
MEGGADPTTKSGFELEAAREILELHRQVDTESDEEIKGTSSVPHEEIGDDIDGEWSVLLI